MTFTVTPAQYTRLLGILGCEPGCTIDQDKHTCTYDGVELGYQYNGTDTTTWPLLMPHNQTIRSISRSTV